MFELPSLHYDYASLGDYISGDIMELHHSKHHKSYVNNLNKALQSIEGHHGQSIEEILTQLDSLPEQVRTAVRNNGGGHYNHSLFWQWMSPSGGGEPSGELAQQIAQKFGSFQEFVDVFSKQASGVFGSGWAWLLPDMSIMTTPNQDTPIMQGLDAPILGIDVWEHAYYLNYQNRRPDYVAAWWNVVNWEQAASNYASSK
ncbi:MAG TPA: superoxide dismutase [Candidatus Saccharibacteria bacterium]|nr:superoxide dismutase [Candidatus Saccharibacteria bacterium]